jgi:hypothetical protein
MLKCRWPLFACIVSHWRFLRQRFSALFQECEEVPRLGTAMPVRMYGLEALPQEVPLPLPSSWVKLRNIAACIINGQVQVSFHQLILAAFVHHRDDQAEGHAAGVPAFCVSVCNANLCAMQPKILHILQKKQFVWLTRCNSQHVAS